MTDTTFPMQRHRIFLGDDKLGDDGRQLAVNLLLAELDGIVGNNSGIVLIPASNRASLLDPALAGRFNHRIKVGLPTVADRVQLLSIYTRDMVLAASVDLPKVAELCPFFSGIQEVCCEAAAVAQRRFDATVLSMRTGNASEQDLAKVPREITMDDFIAAIDRTGNVGS
jgi:ATP-dependent 26S proteasome regulatory subunit